MKITVLGAGAWGTAIAQLLADNGHNIILWCYEPEVAQEISDKQTNSRYLPNIALNKSITTTIDLKHAITASSWIFEAIPVKFLRNTINNCIDYIKDQKWVLLSKGIENNSLFFEGQILCQVIEKELNYCPDYVILSGPSFAYDLARKQPTGVTLASSKKAIAIEVQEIVTNNYFKTEITDDVMGTQICGAFKNIIALTIGMLDGAGYTDNTKAFFATKSIEQLAILNKSLGGKNETIYSLAGLGDLILTAFGSKSKNFWLGQQLGKGKKINELEASTIESANTLSAAYQLINQHKLNIPLFSTLYNIVFNEKPVVELINLFF